MRYVIGKNAPQDDQIKAMRLTSIGARVTETPTGYVVETEHELKEFYMYLAPEPVAVAPPPAPVKAPVKPPVAATVTPEGDRLREKIERAKAAEAERKKAEERKKEEEKKKGRKR